MTRKILLLSVLAVVLHGCTAHAESQPFSGWFGVDVVSDSPWSRCELFLSVDPDNAGTARARCATEPELPRAQVERPLTRAEGRELRRLLRAADPFGAQNWGLDLRGVDGPVITMVVSDGSRVVALVAVKNESFDTGPKKALLAWLIQRLDPQALRATPE